jgi:F-type H+-transporting ATPase subunit b
MNIHTLYMVAAAEEVEGIAALGIDPLALLAQATTFLVLFFIVKKFALEKIVQMLEQRHQTIDDGIKLGLKMQAEEAKLQEIIDQQLRETRTQADQILADARRESGEIIKEAELKANQKVDGMISDAHLKIEEDIKRARAALNDDVRKLVADATAVIIGEKLDNKKDAALIDRALQEVRS